MTTQTLSLHKHNLSSFASTTLHFKDFSRCKISSFIDSLATDLLARYYKINVSLLSSNASTDLYMNLVSESISKTPKIESAYRRL